MKKFKNVLSVVLTFALIMSMMTACGKTEITDNTAVTQSDPSNDDATDTMKEDNDIAAEQNPVTLTTVSMFGGTDANAGNYQAINEQFMLDNSYITIEDDSQSSDQDWKTKIAADFAVGNEPDVIQYFTDANASDVLAANKFVSIDEIKAVYPEPGKLGACQPKIFCGNSEYSTTGMVKSKLIQNFRANVLILCPACLSYPLLFACASV